MKNILPFSIIIMWGLFILMISLIDKKPPKKVLVKEEYRIELINQDSIKIYSTSNDTIYKCLLKDMITVIEGDNL